MTSANGCYSVFVCQGTGCVSSRSHEIRKALEDQVVALGLAGRAEVKLSGCHGFCEQGPLVAIEPDGVLYTQVKEDDVASIAAEHLAQGKPVERLFYRDPATKRRIPYYRDIPFYAKQTRLILRNCGHINPEKIEDYIAVGGFQALEKVLREMTPDQVVQETTRSGLRGGGCWLPHGDQVEFLPPGPGGAQVCHLQRRRGRPRRLHG